MGGEDSVIKCGCRREESYVVSIFSPVGESIPFVLL